MTGEFGRRFRLLEKQVAEIREYLYLPPQATDGDAPKRSTAFIIADITDVDEPTTQADYRLGSVLHLTTDPRLAHELFRKESARAPGCIGMFTYPYIDDIEMRTACDPGTLIAQVLLYLSLDVMHIPVRVNAAEP